MNKESRSRLRSASVQLGALTALALTLTACNGSDDDDDGCAMGPIGGGNPAVALARPALDTAARTATGTRSDVLSASLPQRGGFGTHLASCGG